MYSLFFIQGVFKSHLKKITPTKSANSHPKFQIDQSPSYMNVLKKWLSPSPITEGAVRTMLTIDNFLGKLHEVMKFSSQQHKYIRKKTINTAAVLPQGNSGNITRNTALEKK